MSDTNSNTTNPNGTSKKAPLSVYVIPENGHKWREVGVAFVNRDGSITLHLDALPLSGKLQVREREPKQGETAQF
jgi:hypothetical protein